MYVGTSLKNDLIEVEVRVDGRPQRLYRSTVLDRVFVVGRPGQVYTLGVRVLGHGRVEVLNSVDGRNTLKDEPAVMTKITGLVIRGAGEFTGWRVSDQETRQFMFGNPAQSIAAQATDGDTSNVGVIGFAAYAEYNYAGYRSAAPDLLGGGGYRGATRGLESMGATRGGSIGTGAGATISDRVGTTHFERYGAAQELVIGYDTEEVLRELGVLRPALPQAFPAEDTGYAKYAGM